MKYNFNTAEDFKNLPEDERLTIVKEIVSNGYNASLGDYTDFTEERRVFEELQSHYRRIEALAYAIGDELKAYKDSLEGDEYDDADTALMEFMSDAAAEVEQNYCGEYCVHEDGFWVPSNC